MIYQETKRLAVETAARIAHGQALTDANAPTRESILKGLESFTPHWFRHTGATIAINKGFMTLYMASKMLGHTSPVVTASMYLEADHQAMRGGVDAMAGAVVTSQP